MKVVSVTFHAPLDLSIHKSQGLYDPSSEHDACGVGMVTTLNKRPERKIIDDAIEVLVNLNHRGAVGAEENTGDGAGILMSMPDEFMRATTGVELPEAGHYAAGIAFLDRDIATSGQQEQAIASIVREEGLEVLAWRVVPTNPDGLGLQALASMPSFKTLVIADAEGKLAGIELDRIIVPSPFFEPSKREERRRLKHDNAQVLEQNLQSDEHEHHAARYGSRLLEARAEPVAHRNADEGQDERGHPDDDNGSHHVHAEEGEGYAHRKRIDARRDGHHEKLAHVELLLGAPAGFAPIVATKRIPQHFPADESKQNERDPVIDGLDKACQLRPERPADQGHESLEPAEHKRDDKGVAPVHLLHAEPFANGDREGVHRQPHPDHEQLDKAHDTLL